MPRGELVEYMIQFGDVIEILSGGAVKLKEPEEPDEDEDV